MSSLPSRLPSPDDTFDRRVETDNPPSFPRLFPPSQIANGVAGYKLENPDVSDQEAIKILLPDAKFVETQPREGEEKGEMAMQVDGAFPFMVLHLGEERGRC